MVLGIKKSWTVEQKMDVFGSRRGGQVVPTSMSASVDEWAVSVLPLFGRICEQIVIVSSFVKMKSSSLGLLLSCQRWCMMN